MFRQHRGLQLLALVEEVLPRHGSGRHGDWHISLSKPSEKEQHLLMTLVGEQGERGQHAEGRAQGGSMKPALFPEGHGRSAEPQESMQMGL